jgi:FKBP-type peptidyl-prolyl cis-trans isomerase SlyD
MLGAVQIGPQKVVSIDYTLTDDAGHVIDGSSGRQPLSYLHGAGNIVPGLEAALDGKSVGETVVVSLNPEQGYGLHDERLVRNIAVRKLPEQKAEVGMSIDVQTENGPRRLLVKARRGDYATVDANHPLAGMTLHFSVKVVEIRDATEEELAHGHVHGPHGHAHG